MLIRLGTLPVPQDKRPALVNILGATHDGSRRGALGSSCFMGAGMLHLQSGDRIELAYQDAPTNTIRATVGRLLTDHDEGMGIEVEDYIACWMEITVDEPSDMETNQIILLGNDFQYRLNGRPVIIRRGQACAKS
jgi:hypothetical protein